MEPLGISEHLVTSESNYRSSITNGFPYPEFMFQTSHDLNVGGKKKAKL